MTPGGRQILLVSTISVGFGVYTGGFILDYRAFFVTTDGLQDTLAIPAILLGLAGGWWCWAPTLVYLFTTSLVLWLRAIVGRDLDLEYYQFAFGLTVIPVWEFVFQTILAAYIGAVAGWPLRRIWNRIRIRFWPHDDREPIVEDNVESRE